MINELLECRGYLGNALADGRFALSGSSPHYAPDRFVDAQHIRLELKLDFARKTLGGVVTTRFQAIAEGASTLIFDAVDFQNVKVSSRGKAVPFEYNKRQIRVKLSKPLKRGESTEISVAYKVVQPKLGLHFIGPDKGYPNKPQQVWTQGEDEYNRFWFPCHDAPQERATTEMIITVPEKFTAVSNGRLVGTSNHRSGRTKTFHYKQDIPHPAYLTSLAIGEFSVIKDQWRNIPVLYYCVPGKEADARRAFGKTPKMLEFFSTKLGVPYAYAKYSQVAAIDFIYGGMENISATTQTALTLHDERAHIDFSSDPLVAHELAHQWFGDLVTCKDWSHAWLNESFATYFEALFKEHDMGHDEFVYEIYENAQAYFSEDRERYRRAMVTHTFKNPNDLFDRHLYEKGSVILHMLRRLLGDADFWRSMNLYLTRHRAQGVETVDLINAIQDATGRNMRPFFDQWIFKAGHPEYKVRYWWDARAKKAFVRVLQTHSVNGETGLFSMPITLAFHTEKGEQRFTETVDKKEHLFSYALGTEPKLVLFDPDHSVLKRVDFAKPEAMWIYQLSKDPHVLGRLDAAARLGQIASAEALTALSKALLTEKFWGTSSEIARAIGKIGTTRAITVLIDALRNIHHPKVRRALFEALGSCHTVRVLSEFRDRYAEEESYFAAAEAIRGMGRMGDAEVFPLLKQLLGRESWNDILRCAALDAIAMLKVPESVDLLKRYTAYGHSPQARMAAIRALTSYGSTRPDVQDHLIGMLNEPYLLVQIAVVRALGIFADERAVDALLKYTTGDLDGRLKRTAEESIRRIRKGMEPELPQPAAKK